ncbi:MAG: polymer-forming cytoskeletal protein [Deltaproteobacteria bacterium]|nr:polymer-forming cytoskeletal protein [Deltaproteobacteria bacterium]MBK8241375.1 polymer-forming cytoskeletal protein [Deltaproteobacteria bacterium]MBK8717091.1 polymer-forming cytoskeletal protein [Deltaproteobacteria bacterium]MBP7286386.1 polymer-forming cytoskeletal protein [Nannocystaceae bacterium]
MARTTHASTPLGGSTNGTVIGPDIRVLGRVSGEEDLHVQGRIDGAISLTQTLYVAPGGIVAAEVDAHDVVISGVVIGNVTARDCVTLHAGAKLVGDINAPRLVVADGAAFKGNVRMGAEPPPAREKPRVAAARTRPVTTTARRPTPAVTRAPERAERAVTLDRAPERRAPPKRTERAEPARDTVDDEPTVIVRHNALPADPPSPPEAEPEARFRGVRATRADVPARAETPANAPKKKLSPRARIPKPGKRRVSRR